MPPVTFDSNTVMVEWVPFRVDSRPEVGNVIFVRSAHTRVIGRSRSSFISTRMLPEQL